MTMLRVRRKDGDSPEDVSETNPFPVSFPPAIAAGCLTFIRPLQIPGIGTAAAYAALDQFGSLLSIPVPQQGIVREIRFHDFDYEGLDKEVWFFASAVTLAADNAAFSLSDSDNTQVLGVAYIGTWRDAVNNKIGFTSNTPFAYGLPPTIGVYTIYVAVKTLGADNIAAGSIPALSFVIERYEQ